MCGASIISFFDKDVKFPVYCSKCWWSDKWDPLSYGREYDFGRPFFEQFGELMQKVPKVGMLQLNNENCDYNALIAFSKNSYMSPGSYVVEDCYYLRKSQYCKDCANSNFLDHCELVCSSVNCNNCYSSSGLIDCRNCSDCHYVAHAAGCQNCFMCSDVVSKKFAFKNVVYGEIEYRKILEKYRGVSPEALMKEFRGFMVTVPKKFQNQINCENSSGDYIQNCKNAENCFDCFDLEDCKNMIESVDVKDSMDLSMHDKEIELCYECCSGGEKNYNLKFAFCTCASPNSTYLYSCFYAGDCFGCDGIHSKTKNCILNKQYSEGEYKGLVAKIIEGFGERKDGFAMSEFFPPNLSLYGYNDSSAQDFYPLTKEEALKRGFKWKEKDPAQYRQAPKLSERNPEKLTDSVTKEIFACSKCGKNFQVLAQELKLFKKMGQGGQTGQFLSDLCGNCRFDELTKLKNKRKLWERKCGKCGVEIKSTYEPGGEVRVYCEKCYLENL